MHNRKNWIHLGSEAAGPRIAAIIRLLPDGGKEIYAQSDGATSFPRRIFLTQIIDPAGNAVTLNYDNQQRLSSITDATGRNTTFSYELTSNPLLVTRITDPFGRSAQIAYDASGRLVQITDVIGLKSQFAYDANSLVTSMTTPYGTTTFAFGTGTGYGPSRFLEVTDPLGNHERVEYLQGAPGIASEESPVPVGITPFNYQGSMFMNGRNTFYWDKHALAVARGDYTKARIRHWLHDSTDPTGTTTSSVIQSVKNPLGRRIWRNYPGQFGGGSTGSLDKPSIVARVLDDGTTQSTLFTYNYRGKPVRVTDPIGRVTLYDYDANAQIDLVGIRQQTAASGITRLASFTYNTQHLPVTYTDAGGQTTTYAYNSAGQVTKVTDPLSQSTTFVYDGLGEIRTYTDVNGFTRTYAYDASDRLNQTSYPDGTKETFSHTNLDLTQSSDRLNRATHYTYNPMRQLIQVVDPLARVLKYEYCACGSLISLTDGAGNITEWLRDIQNRVVTKV